ncbi:MAG: hypothetical protein COB01_07830 [Lutibacter sp.]|nr:MAG: hypothetical protein COB01_07830 [Lutibacter sp.]
MKKAAIILLLFCVCISNSQNQEPRYNIKNIAKNTALSNFGTTFYGEDKLVFASPAKRNYIISNLWKGNNKPFLELYVGTITGDGEIKDVEKLSNIINTRFHEADVTFSNDKKTVYFTRSNFFEGKYRKDTLGINRLKIFKATLGVDGKWSKITNMPFNNDNYSVGHPTLSKDQKTLYFISDMPGSLGKTDIFKVAIFEDGSYGEPENLGPDINTSGREMFPYISGNDELYFSTDGRDGLGMLDVFMSKLGANSIISTKHLEEPINSKRDDFAFIINSETREGYFSSDRIGGRGSDDIYYFKEEKPIIIVCKQSVTGVVKDMETGSLLPGTLVTLYKDTTRIDSLTITVGEDASFKFPLECESNYKIIGSREYYYDNSIQINTSDEIEKVHDVVLELKPDEEFRVIGDKVMLKINTIYFDYDKSLIRRDAAIELDKAIKILKKYPKIIVEFGAHCDSRGPDSYNDQLSERRANSTVDYMVANGISRSQLSGKGYGERMLTNKCSNGVKCTEKEHERNRRTEFVITNPEFIEN